MVKCETHTHTHTGTDNSSHTNCITIQCKAFVYEASYGAGVLDFSDDEHGWQTFSVYPLKSSVQINDNWMSVGRDGI